MQLFAFRGTRYDPSNDDPGRMAAPPFDQIDAELAQRLRADPRCFAHLTRPDPASDDPHRAAADTQLSWFEQGILMVEDTPCLYLYETRLASGGSRLGICGLIGLDARAFRPHERTVSKTVDERLDLVTKVEADLEPIFLLCDDPGTLNAALENDADGASWLASYNDEFGNTHSIAAIREPERINIYQQLLEGQSGLIADGHHRYKVAGLHAEQVGAKAGTAAACKLVVVISLRSPHLTIDPIHRASKTAIDTKALLPFVRSRQPWRGADGEGLAMAVATAGQPTVGVWHKGADPELWTLDEEAILAHATGPVPPLPVTLLDSLFDQIGWDDQAATDGTITYRSDPARLYREMSAGDCEVSFWLPPMSPEAFAEALDIQELLPPKSTRFLPKLASGLVWARHDAELLGRDAEGR